MLVLAKMMALSMLVESSFKVWVPPKKIKLTSLLKLAL